MAKKSEPIAKRISRFRIRAKFADFVLCPANAIERAFYQMNLEFEVPEFVTDDGVVCRPVFQTTWNNKDDGYADELAGISQDMFGIPFESIRSIWIGRLDRIDDYWHLIKLERK